MRFGYADDLVKRYPSLRAGVLWARGLRNGPSDAAVEALLDTVASRGFAGRVGALGGYDLGSAAVRL